jgi:uncharacterized protein YndB with AHSA1/START domain
MKPIDQIITHRQMRQVLSSLLFIVLLASPAVAAELAPIISEAIVKAPPSAVWKAWTTSEGLRSWLAPLAEVDLRIDGLIRTSYNPKGSLGDEGTIENRILSFEPERMLSIKVAKAPAGFPFPKAVKDMWTVIYLQEREGGRTLVRAVGLGFTDDPESARMREFFQKGNDFTLRELQKRFEP